MSSIPNHGTVKETPTRVYRSTPAVKQIKTESRIAVSCVAKVLYCFFSSISMMVLLYWISASTVIASTRIKTIVCICIPPHEKYRTVKLNES